MILRTPYLELLKRQLANLPVVAILGARQVGKTTLARQLENDWGGPKRHFDLEDPDNQARLADPAFVLREIIRQTGAKRDEAFFWGESWRCRAGFSDSSKWPSLGV